MTVWEFASCVEGYNRSQGKKDTPEMSDTDYEALCELGDMWSSENA